MKFLANLLGAGHEGVVRYALAKQKAVRWHRRAETVGDIDRATADRMLREADCTREEADAIYQLTALCTFEDRFVIPPMHREQAIEMMKEPHEHREEAASVSSVDHRGDSKDGRTTNLADVLSTSELPRRADAGSR